MTPARLPLPLRLAAFGSAVAVLMWLSLAPVSELPGVTFWDKAQHALAYFVLTGLGLTLFPTRAMRIVGFVFGLGIGIEVAQALGHAGRQGDWHDVVANSLGLVLALGVFVAVRRVRRR